MPRGRPKNLPRSLARDIGERMYSDEANPCWCGNVVRYTSNAQCTECTISKAKNRYATLSPEQLVIVKQRDHERYILRSLSKPPGVIGRPFGSRNKPKVA